MNKDLNISVLLDFYGNLLTEKQLEVIECYYNEDLSLAEIAQLTGITRQGVRDSIKRGEMILLDAEEKLGFYKRFTAIQQMKEQILKSAAAIKDHNLHAGNSPRIDQYADRIIECASQLDE